MELTHHFSATPHLQKEAPHLSGTASKRSGVNLTWKHLPIFEHVCYLRRIQRQILLKPKTLPSGSPTVVRGAFCCLSAGITTHSLTEAVLDLTLNFTLNTGIFFKDVKCRKCRAGELICGAFFSFQFAYHLLHLPLLTPEGLREDFDLNRKSRVV